MLRLLGTSSGGGSFADIEKRETESFARLWCKPWHSEDEPADLYASEDDGRVAELVLIGSPVCVS